MKRILLVDDDMDDLFFFCEALKEVAPLIECVTAYNGKHALHKLQNERPFFFDLIITDINMPLMDGKSLLQATRGMRQCPPYYCIIHNKGRPGIIIIRSSKSISQTTVYYPSKNYHPGNYRSLCIGMIRLYHVPPSQYSFSSPSS